ncbi:MAG TPA: hypothetical protein VF407_04765, partial [Polyangiaceae bacterium]
MEAPTRDSSELPRRARRKRDWGRTFARVLCVLFALVGALPVLVALIVRSASVQAWATRETTRLLAEQGITAAFHVGVRLWPLSLDVTDIKVDSKDGGDPVVVSKRASVRPRFFPLLSGKLAIDQIDLDAPRVRVVIEGKTIKNMGIDIPESKGGAIHAPFDVFAITDGAADVTVNGVQAVAEDVDLDVTADDDPVEGSSFEIAVRTGESKVLRSRATKEGGLLDAWDEDKICEIEGRLRIEPNDIEVHRLKAGVIADLDPEPNTLGECNLPTTDRRHVDLALTHLHVGLPRKKGDLPRIDGHATVRAPIGLAARFVPFPDNDGWVAADVDVRFAEGMQFPDLNGHVEAHDLRITNKAFAQEIQSDVKTDKGVITSPKTTVAIAGGVATISDVKVEPLVKGIPLRAGKVDVKGADFTKLMSNLGVSDHAHVQWDLDEVHTGVFAGTVSPLKIDADFTAKTKNFVVSDMAIDNPAHTRIVGVREGNIVAHVGVRPTALTFSNVH